MIIIFPVTLHWLTVRVKYDVLSCTVMFFASCIELHFSITLSIFQIVDMCFGLHGEERML